MCAAERPPLMKLRRARFPLTGLHPSSEPRAPWTMRRGAAAPPGLAGPAWAARAGSGGAPAKCGGGDKAERREEAHSQGPRENLQLLWRRWDRLKALVFAALPLYLVVSSRRWKKLEMTFSALRYKKLHGTFLDFIPSFVSLFLAFNPWKTSLCGHRHWRPGNRDR